MKTIKEEKARLRKVVLVEKKQTVCGCCGQKVQLYKRTFNGNMARALALIYKLANKDYIHVQKEFSKLNLRATSMDYIQLSRWKMIESKPNPKDPDKKDSGLWRITDYGIQFLNKSIKVPAFVYVYDNKTHSYSTLEVSIIDIIDKKFKYSELFNFKT